MRLFTRQFPSLQHQRVGGIEARLEHRSRLRADTAGIGDVKRDILTPGIEDQVEERPFKVTALDEAGDRLSPEPIFMRSGRTKRIASSPRPHRGIAPEKNARRRYRSRLRHHVSR